MKLGSRTERATREEELSQALRAAGVKWPTVQTGYQSGRSYAYTVERLTPDQADVLKAQGFEVDRDPRFLYTVVRLWAKQEAR